MTGRSLVELARALVDIDSTTGARGRPGVAGRTSASGASA